MAARPHPDRSPPDRRTDRRIARLLAALAVAALVTAPTAGVVAAGNAASPPAFEESVYSVQQGETAEIAINTTSADDTARLAIGDAGERNFEVRATVIDANGDGTVTVEFDTGAVHESAPGEYLSVAGDDAVENRTEVAGVGDPLDPASYALSIGDPADPAEVASLAVLSGDGGTEGDDGASSDDTETPRPTHDGTSLDTTDGEVRVAPATGQTISGETTLDAGTPISIRVVSESPSSPFLVTAETTVEDDGTFEGTFDFSDMSSGTPIKVNVRTDDRFLIGESGRIVDCESDCPTGTTTDSGDGETATPTPLDTDEIQVRTIVHVDQGDVARIPVTFGDADALTVTIGDEEAVNYETTAVIRDTNGDGRAVVVFRTNATDDADRPALAVAEAGETRPVNVTGETRLDSPLDPAPYSVDVFRGESADGDPAAIGTIAVEASDGGGQSTEGGDGAGDDAGAADDPPGPGAATVAADDSGSFATGVGALALGGLIAFGGVAMFLGFVRG